MTPKQRRLLLRIKHQRIKKVKNYVFGILIIAGFIKLLSEGLKLL
jgi:hypothetical protein